MLRLFEHVVVVVTVPKWCENIVVVTVLKLFEKVVVVVVAAVQKWFENGCSWLVLLLVRKSGLTIVANSCCCAKVVAANQRFLRIVIHGWCQ